MAIAFVDVARFTVMTRAHGDDYAADVHDAFVDALDAACAATRGLACVKHLRGATSPSERHADVLAALADRAESLAGAAA